MLDLTSMHDLDVAEASALAALVGARTAADRRTALVGLSGAVARRLTEADPSRGVAASFAVDDDDAMRLLEFSRRTCPKERLVRGLEIFRRQQLDRYAALFFRLAVAQTPHTLFITCADSRIVPNLVTTTDPGELFIVRNVGNLVPPFGDDATPAEGAAVEYALCALGVEDVVVCGHSACGAIKAMLAPETAELPSVNRWLDAPRQALAELRPLGSHDDAARANVRIQLANLRTYPAVRDRLADGVVHLHGWYYDIERGTFEEWDENARRWGRVGVGAPEHAG